jgi:curved DNA-binding protein CbpA
MKPAQERTHYQTLGIPVGASPFEIHHAYLEAFELYQDDSMAASAFFSDADRREILVRLEDAYLILINPASRTDYDRTLMDKGIIEEGQQFRDKTNVRIPLYAVQREKMQHHWLPRASGVDKALVSENRAIQEILRQDRLSGPDLKKMRTELGVPLERIALETKVTIAILESIEEDRSECFPPEVYLKSFLKLYAQCLQLDANVVIQAYMRHWKAGSEP